MPAARFSVAGACVLRKLKCLQILAFKDYACQIRSQLGHSKQIKCAQKPCLAQNEKVKETRLKVIKVVH